MHQNKRQKTTKQKAPSFSNEEKWCLDSGDNLNFKNFIEKFDCLDRKRAQHRYEYILNKHFSTKNDRNKGLKENYKSWKASADYVRFWEQRLDKGILQNLSLASSELMDITTSKKVEELKVAASSSESHDVATSENDSNPATPNENDYYAATTLTEFELENNVVKINMVGSNDDTEEEKWIFNHKNITSLFKSYQQTVHKMVEQHTTLPLESYIHELAALTNILVICKNQHSALAEKIFTLDLLKHLSDELTSALTREIQFSQKNYADINTHITLLSQSSTPDRERSIVALTNMYPDLNYGEKRIIMGINNLIQKLPITPLNDYTDMSESELWSTYFDPMLSVLISDPDKLIHLRWSNTIPSEKGKSRPDAVISKKPQMDFRGNVGFGEVKVWQGNGKRSLCMDTLRLTIFMKNAIDVNMLDGALAFQIHGFHITFFMMQLNAKGIYTFVELDYVRFPQSLEDLPCFFTLATLGRLLKVHDCFWRHCKKSANPDMIESRYKPTLLTLDNAIDSSHDSTRSCQLRYGH
ncbi:hypothetical protein BC941DRAFT_354975 [Chlamydoabsidia padenii]|nr:hypothetical protein BC941DRAFT_354975 [Chlamydoabsidia padenii]